MRIISGSGRGRKLKAVPGEETRPTSDRLNEAMFNIVQFAVEGRRVLDLFAGTGQLGIEALSRGAAEAVFVDMAGGAIAVIRENIKSTGFEDRARVCAGEALSFLSAEKGKFDLVFIDPPYHTALLQKTLAAAQKFDILREGGILVVECASDDALPEIQPPYVLLKTYEYGQKKIVTCARREAAE